MKTKDYKKTIRELAIRKRIKVGIGIIKYNNVLIESLRKSMKFVDLIIIGKPISGFYCIETDQPEKEIVSLLKKQEIDGLVKGNLDALKLKKHFMDEFNYKKVNRLSIISDNSGNCLFLGPFSVNEGKTLSDRIEYVKQSIDFMNRLNLEPKIGVLASRRRNSIVSDEKVDQTYEEAEKITEIFKSKGMWIKNYGIEIEFAVREANLIIPPNGQIGNIIYRCITFLGGGEDLGSPALVDEIYIGGSRNHMDMETRIILAAAMANI